MNVGGLQTSHGGASFLEESKTSSQRIKMIALSVISCLAAAAAVALVVVAYDSVARPSIFLPVAGLAGTSILLIGYVVYSVNRICSVFC
ncbi:MAG: hypothetical protein JSR97_09710 [Verrucomicrobia bacterium]|nr:hypothetical protein [Verrucomicrobiota bacterium]